MGRKRKIDTQIPISSQKTVVGEYNVNQVQFENGTQLKCSVCDKVFTFTDDSKYICRGGYTCSWKCFTDYVKQNPKQPTATKGDKKIKTIKNPIEQAFAPSNKQPSVQQKQTRPKNKNTHKDESNQQEQHPVKLF